MPAVLMQSVQRRSVGRSGSRKNQQKQKRNDEATSRRRVRGGCSDDRGRLDHRHGHPASESGRSGQRQSGGESEFFHVGLRFVSSSRLDPPIIEGATELLLVAG